MTQTIVEPKAHLAIFKPFEAAIAEYKAENEKLVFDYEDPKGNKEARSHIYKLRLVKGKIAEAHKTAKADVLAAGREIDAVKNKLIGDVEEMIDVHNQPLLLIEKEKADAEAKRLKDIADAEAARLKAEADAKAKAEAKRLAEIEAREAEVRKAEEAVKAEQKKVADEQARLLAEQQARQAETERIEREKRIAEEAKVKAAAALAEAKAALEAAERKRLADIAAAKARAKAEAEAKELAERRKVEAEAAKAAECDRLEKKRTANEKHRRQVRNEIGERFAEFDGAKDPVKGIYDALIAGTIPHVRIEY